MRNATTPSLSYRFAPRAALAALGLRRQGLHLCGPVRDHGHMAHKTGLHPPGQQWEDAFIALLAGAHGLGAINKRLRSDPGLHAAFGRQTCAEPSVGQETLDACPEAHVTQRPSALDVLSRRQRQGDRHDYPQRFQGLDGDMPGMPCGQKAALATQGSCAKQRHRRGRPLGRVLATRYGAMVGARLCSGTTHLTTALRPLGQATAQPREREADTRRRTLWRIDAGGGSVDEVTWRLERASPVHGKDDAGTRAPAWAARVTHGVDAPRMAGRQGGWVVAPATADVRPGPRMAGQGRKKNGQWGGGVLLATLSPHEVMALTQPPVNRVKAPHAVLLASVSC